MNNQGKPYFSVIVPVYNRRGEVRDLLESLSKQTDRDFEVMLVEDGSTERCDDIAQAYADKVDVSRDISFSQLQSWVLKKGNTDLCKKINEQIKAIKADSLAYSTLLHRYF